MTSSPLDTGHPSGSPHTPPPPPQFAPIAVALEQLTVEIKREHDRAARREEIIDRLHADNRELRHGLLQEALIPVRAGLYRLYDLTSREASRLRDESGESAHFGALMAAVAGEVAEVLARTGAERLESGPGDPYDSTRHRAIRTEPGPDGQIVAVLADGFQCGERILRKADVTVGRSTPETGDLAPDQQQRMENS